MTSNRKQKESLLVQAFKRLLKEQCYGSQGQLAEALASQGFEDMSQAKISRLLSKLGAVKTRNTNNEMIYILPDELAVPKSKQSIESVVLSVKHNQMQIIIKTVIGAATLISKMIESMGEQAGVLACMASDSTILVIPADVRKIQQTMSTIIEHLDINL